MSKNSTFWWIALAVWMAGATWWHVCKIKQLCDASLVPADAPSVEAVEIVPLRITDGAGLSLVSPGNFGFAKSGAAANLTAVKKELDSLAAYLRANPKKKLTITGYYHSSEVNDSKWSDLGIARAEGIRQYYVDMGLPAASLVTASELQETIRFSPDSLNGGIGFAFGTQEPTTEDALAGAQKYQGLFKPLDLYFNTGSTDYIHTADNQKFVEEAQKYLAANKDKKLLLTGHTDNTGNQAGNVQLSRKRADEVKRQLVSAGLPEDQLVTAAKGQASPKESNSTAEGRAANRRVEIIVQ
ncbi:OmpA family protein [Dyadobacter sp. 676]|uniref:OmpA family protein n=1 Tax=Dyadobacter sp. 676 TaxID=3088362 RepID=A0AAU8FJP2_9BACT